MGYCLKLTHHKNSVNRLVQDKQRKHSPYNTKSPVPNGSVGLHVLWGYNLKVWDSYRCCKDSMLRWGGRCPSLKSHDMPRVSVSNHRHNPTNLLLPARKKRLEC